MKTRKNENTSWKYPKKVFKIFLVFILIIYIQFVYVSLSPNIYGINMDEFAKSRNTVKTTLPAARGNIYDKDKNVLALNVTSYTVIAYLDKSRTGSSKTPLHVVDKKKTAELLAPILNMDASYLEKLLSKKAYQVELGPGGRGISELKKTEIEALNLPGIDFVESHKRYYPNGDFLSYAIGYAKDVSKDENKNEITGELGIELEYNDLLKGKDGYLEYQKDRFGYKIPDTKETRVEAEDGSDVYLTIDSNIQRFVETAVKEATAESNPEWMVLAVMDAKTGDILGSASTPSFDPNKKNITNYQNPLISFTYEPGSVMKTFSYMCAIEKGTYNGSATYDSTKIEFEDDTIRDWNRVGFGIINYDKGYEYSSNVGASNLIGNFISKEDLKKCYEDYGFGKTTGIELPREHSGKISFKYPIEIASATFGQAITTTAIQQLRALSIISNNGKMLTPHIVDKIENPNTGEILYESKKTETKALVSESTISKIKELMYNVVHSTDGYATGRPYNIEGYDVIGKTGTAQYVDSRTGKYMYGSYIYSFSGMFPKDDPEIIVYSALAKPKTGTNTSMQKAVRNVMQNIATYKNMFNKNEVKPETKRIDIESYTNKSLNETLNKLNGINVVVIGNGTKIIDQYPKSGTKLSSMDTVILKTNDSNIVMPNTIGWSSGIVEAYFDLIKIPYTKEGYGYVNSQSIPAGTPINKDSIINFTLSDKYVFE